MSAPTSEFKDNDIFVHKNSLTKICLFLCKMNVLPPAVMGFISWKASHMGPMG